MFLEPQHYSSFIIPLLYFTLKRKKILYSLIISISILLSTSTQGIIMAASIWIFFLVKKYKNIKIKLFAASVFMLIIVFFVNSEISEYAIYKVLNVDIFSDVRIARGFGIFAEMSILDKLVGIGPASISSYIMLTGRSAKWMIEAEHISNFISSYSGVLVQFGIISSIIFNVLLFKLYKFSKNENLGFFFLILIALFSQTILFNLWYILYFSILFNTSNKSKKDFIILKI